MAKIVLITRPVEDENAEIVSHEMHAEIDLTRSTYPELRDITAHLDIAKSRITEMLDEALDEGYGYDFMFKDDGDDDDDNDSDDEDDGDNTLKESPELVSVDVV